MHGQAGASHSFLDLPLQRTTWPQRSEIKGSWRGGHDEAGSIVEDATDLRRRVSGYGHRNEQLLYHARRSREASYVHVEPSKHGQPEKSIDSFAERWPSHRDSVGFSITSVYVNVRQWHRDLQGHNRLY